MVEVVETTSSSSIRSCTSYVCRTMRAYTFFRYHEIYDYICKNKQRERSSSEQ